MRKVLSISLLHAAACGLPTLTQGQSAPTYERSAAETVTTAQQFKAYARRDHKAEAIAKQYCEMGQELHRLERYYEASKTFRRALLYKDDYTDAYLGHAYAALGRWPAAAAALEQALRLSPDNAQARAWLDEVNARLQALADTQAVAAAPHADRQPPPYRVGPGDVLWIRLLNMHVHKQATLYNVLADGQLDYPLAGEPLMVAGLTTDEIAARLVTMPLLRTISETPRLIVGVHYFASHTITVRGLVDDPGEKVMRSETLPLYVVLAAALARPEAGQVLIESPAGGRRIVPYDLTDHAAMHTLIHKGDQLTVEAAPPQFITIAGLINQPGQKNFHAGLTLTQALLLAGGVREVDSGFKTLTRTVLTTSLLLGSRRARYMVVLMRPDGSGGATRMAYSLQEIETGETPDPLLRPGDSLTVKL